MRAGYDDGPGAQPGAGTREGREWFPALQGLGGGGHVTTGTQRNVTMKISETSLIEAIAPLNICTDNRRGGNYLHLEMEKPRHSVMSPTQCHSDSK